MSRKILVTGATGNIGSYVVPLLAASEGVTVTALTRDKAGVSSMLDAIAEVAEGAFDDADSLTTAMAGVDTVVLIVPPGPDCVTQNEAIIGAAKSAGVQKVVRISAIKAAEDGRTENTRLHGQCDSLLVDSGLTYTILRPNYFMQNIFMSLETINNDNMFAAGMGDGRFAMIDVRDVAESAAVATTSTKFDNQVLEIGGPTSISFHDVANVLSEVAGRPVSYVAVSPEDVKAALLQIGMDEWMADLLREYSEAYGDGWGDLVTNNVLKLTGHPARSFEQFAAEVLAGALS